MKLLSTQRAILYRRTHRHRLRPNSSPSLCRRQRHPRPPRLLLPPLHPPLLLRLLSRSMLEAPKLRLLASR